MQYLYEQSDILNSSYEAFWYGSSAPDFPVKSHLHYFMEIIYVTEGNALVYINQREYLLSSGDLILFLPHEVHSIYTASYKPLRYAVLKFDLNALHFNHSHTPKLASLFKSSLLDPNISPIFKESELHDFEISKLIDDCVKEITNKEYGYDITMQALFSTLLTKLIRIWKKAGFSTDHTLQNKQESWSLLTILEYIDSHTGEQLKVEELAAICNMSYSYFAKNFSELYGQSCKEYMDFVRISKIKDLLLFTDLDLTYISQETGFADCSHMIRSFKKRENITPKQFRLQHKKRKP